MNNNTLIFTHNLTQSHAHPIHSYNQTHMNLTNSIHTSNPNLDGIHINTPINLGYNQKPDIFYGSTSFSDLIRQSDFIAHSNRWNTQQRCAALAGFLRGNARTVLNSFDPGFDELKIKLELRFGDIYSTPINFSLFQNRKQRTDEGFAELADDLERLIRIVFENSPPMEQDKIACSQFILGISDNYIITIARVLLLLEPWR